MLTIYFKNGSKQVIKPTAAFFYEHKGNPRKNKYGKVMPEYMSVKDKCVDICHDLGGLKYELEVINN